MNQNLNNIMGQINKLSDKDFISKYCDILESDGKKSLKSEIELYEIITKDHDGFKYFLRKVPALMMNGISKRFEELKDSNLDSNTSVDIIKNDNENAEDQISNLPTQITKSNNTPKKNKKLDDLNAALAKLEVTDNYALYAYLKTNPEENKTIYEELRAYNQQYLNYPNKSNEIGGQSNNAESTSSGDSFNADDLNNIQSKINLVLDVINNKQYLYHADSLSFEDPKNNGIQNLNSPPGAVVSNKVSNGLVTKDYAPIYEYKFNACNAVGTFNLEIAKRDPSAHNKAPDFKISTNQPLSMKIKGKKLSPEAQVAFYMDMALAAIVANGGPSSENPLYLRGEDKEQIELLWSAFQVLKKHPDLGLKHLDIDMSQSKFQPTTKLFSKDFKIHNAFQDYTAKIELLLKLEHAKKTFDHLKKPDDAVELVKRTQEAFKAENITNRQSTASHTTITIPEEPGSENNGNLPR